MSKRMIIVVFIAAILVLTTLSCSQTVNTSNNIIPEDAKQPSTGSINQAVIQSPGDVAKTEIAATKPVTPTVSRASDILQKPADYVGKEVILEGKIVQECGAGCWFNLKDGNAVIYVDLAPSNLSIPQKVGSNTRVYGVVALESKIPYIIGKKVEFI